MTGDGGEDLQQESIAALERGALPLSAQDRIDALRGGAAWTSDLSVAELHAVRHSGFEPVGMVMGSSVYRIAAQWGYGNVYGQYGGGGDVVQYPCTHGHVYSAEHRTGYNWEHDAFEQGVTAARDAALSRLLDETEQLGAHGVVGVRVIRRHIDSVGGSLEFTVIGTAIRRAGAPALPRPFVSHLDGVAFSKLLHGGYVPVSLAIGIGALEIDPGCGMEWQLNSWGNLRIDQLSGGLEQGRQLGIDHLERDVAAVDADGAVGVDIDVAVHDTGIGSALLVEMTAVGTAVRRYAATPLDEPPLPVVRLR